MENLKATYRSESLHSDTGMETHGVALIHQDEAVRGRLHGLLDSGPTAIWDDPGSRRKGQDL